VLPDDDALTDVALGAGGLIQVLAPEAIHVSMSTISPGLSRSLAGQAMLPRRCLGTRILRMPENFL